MFIDPFVAGVFCTLFAEMLIFFIFAFLKTLGGKRK